MLGGVDAYFQRGRTHGGETLKVNTLTVNILEQGIF